ncbi:DNA polymerase III subunit epsilon [Buchnera aphidicola (Eriosoma lanigerum)]|uniref:DNA polymerase III subunit epsilon n=1 Tax=Buchnera aphidicola TaxID=9 RepID=UPI00346430C4
MNLFCNRKIVLDTETTGINVSGIPYIGHKIIEIGAVEILNRKLTGINFHVYLQPNRKIDKSAFLIHGITDNFLLDKPKFINIAHKFFNFIKGSELIIHNASFDVGFIDYEFNNLNMNFPKIKDICNITDTLSIARKIFPGKKNNLNALCKRYNIPINRVTHNAMLDAQILSKVYLLMTIDQNMIQFSDHLNNDNITYSDITKTKCDLSLLKLASKSECILHEKYLTNMKNQFGKCIWKEKIN